MINPNNYFFEYVRLYHYLNINRITTVTAAIIEYNDKILVARRSSGKHMAGFWEFPGGKIEAGETPEEALKREIMEELNLNIDVGCHFMDSKHQYDEQCIILKAYFAQCQSPFKILNKDHDQVLWISKDHLLNFDFAPADIPIVKALVDLK